jgi:hypothetical protein
VPTQKQPSHPTFLILATLVLAALAYGCGTAGPTMPAFTDEQAQGQVKNIPQGTRTIYPTKTRLPAESGLPAESDLPADNGSPANTSSPTEGGAAGATSLPTRTPGLASRPTPVPMGQSRKNPLARSTIVSAPNWDIQVLDVKRGGEAWKDLQAVSEFNEAAPADMEYLLVKLHVKSTYTDNAKHDISGCDFEVTGDRLIEYSCGMVNVDAPAPILDASVSPGGETEGWAAYLIGKDEKDLILVFKEISNFDENAVRYIALDDGASISIPPDLAKIKPNNLGTGRDKPAGRTEKLVTENWELSINQVVRGEDAWTMVLDANEYNDPPAEGMEYLAVNLHVRYIGTVDRAENINSSYFSSTGNAGVLYDLPLVLEPAPPLDIVLYPGGAYDGWIVLQAAKGETGVMLAFTPQSDSVMENPRYQLLGP